MSKNNFLDARVDAAFGIYPEMQSKQHWKATIQYGVIPKWTQVLRSFYHEHPERFELRSGASTVYIEKDQIKTALDACWNFKPNQNGFEQAIEKLAKYCVLDSDETKDLEKHAAILCTRYRIIDNRRMIYLYQIKLCECKSYNPYKPHIRTRVSDKTKNINFRECWNLPPSDFGFTKAALLIRRLFPFDLNYQQVKILLTSGKNRKVFINTTQLRFSLTACECGKPMPRLQILNNEGLIKP